MTHLSPADVSTQLRDGEELFLLDVRPKQDYENWHLSGSTNIPCFDALERGDTSQIEANLNKIPDDTPIIVICDGGGTAAETAAQYLRSHGYPAKTMFDGMWGWAQTYETYEIDAAPHVTQFVRRGTGCLSYIIHSNGTGIIVDPSQHIDIYRDYADAADLTIVGVVDTHIHSDHISGAHALSGVFGVPYYLHEETNHHRNYLKEETAVESVTNVEDGDRISVGGHDVNVHATPGHTIGSITLETANGLLTGDTCFLEGVGRPDLRPDTDPDTIQSHGEKLAESLEALEEIADPETLVLPGHCKPPTPAHTPVSASFSEVRDRNPVFNERSEQVIATVTQGLPEPPRNHLQIQRLNRGDEDTSRESMDLAEIEIGPNNCATR